MSDEIDITGIDRAELIAELYNNTQPLGLGILQDIKEGLTAERVRAVITSGLDEDLYLDYVAGRPIKVILRDNSLLHARLYDRDAPGGEGTCARIVAALRSRK